MRKPPCSLPHPSSSFPAQDGPLDWDSPEHFYRNRRALLRRRLTWLARAPAATIIADLGETWRAHYGSACRGVRWEAYPLQLLQLVAAGLGGGALACLCDALAWNHKQLGGGMPDLLLWRVLAPPSQQGAAVAAAGTTAAFASEPPPVPERPVGAAEPDPSPPPKRSRDALAAASWPDLALPPGAAVAVRLVEVKGPRDRLSEKQHVWLRILLEAGVGAGVCKVTEPPPQQGGQGGGARAAGKRAKAK